MGKKRPGGVIGGTRMGGERWPDSGRSERWERLADALARLSRDLADARREIVVLERENAALRRRLADVDSGGSAGGDGRPVGMG